MTAPRFLRSATVASCILSMFLAAPAHAQADAECKPTVGQAGKDVIWVPTPQATIDKMLEMAKATPKDYLIDLGSGDGRLVITAAKRGITAHGIEYNPEMVECSKRAAQSEGLAGKASFEKADIFESDFSKASVITLFLLDSINLKLRPRLLELAPGTRLVANTFKMDDWQPDRTETVQNCTQWCTAHLWIVPAKVAGTWKLPDGDLVLEQKFQFVEGRLRRGNVLTPVKGRLVGDQLAFTAGATKYSGRVTANTIEASRGKAGRIRATRVAETAKA